MSKNETLTKEIKAMLEKATFLDLEFIYYFLLRAEKGTAQEY